MTFYKVLSLSVFVQSNWNTMWSVKVCLVQRMTYSVSDSVRATGSGEDLKRGPSP